MRKSKEEAAKTRVRIVHSAADELRKNGIARTALAELMHEADLTHGGFYRHFKSKDQLVAEACAVAMDSLIASMSKAASKKGTRNALTLSISKYLSRDHRDHPENGCPLASLGSELARCDNNIRKVATDAFRGLVGLVEGQMELPQRAAKRRAIVAACTMIGAMTISRIVDDPTLSDAILKEAERSLASTSARDEPLAASLRERVASGA